MTLLAYFLAALAIAQLVTCSLWTPISSPMNVTLTAPAFSKLLLPMDIASFQYPITGFYAFVVPSFNSPYNDQCLLAEPVAVDCLSYFCSTSPSLVANHSYHSLMHNYCNYCVTTQRNVTAFETFHSMKESCPRFLRFNETQCGKGNYPYMFHQMLNRTRVPPFICYCDQTEKFGAQCDAWTNFFIPLSFIAGRAVMLVVGVLLFVMSLVLCFIPQFGLRLRKFFKSSNKRQHWKTCFDIRLQSMVACLATIGLNVLEQINGLIYYSKMGSPLRKITGGVFRAFSVFASLLGYSVMLILWYHIIVVVCKSF